MIQVGDKRMEQPCYSTQTGGDPHTGPLPCTVIYVHPQRRYYTVRFEVYGGGCWTESFMIYDRR